MLALIGMLLSLSSVYATTNVPGRNLIVLTVPGPQDPYYGKYYQDIAQFHAGYVNAVVGRDNVIVTGPAEALTYMASLGVPQDVLLEATLGDIWMRDFTTVGMRKNVMFTYLPDYLYASEARKIQSLFKTFLAQCGFEPNAYSNLIIDGGNVVDNGYEYAIVTDRVWYDNAKMTKNEIINNLESYEGYSEVAMIQQENDTTGHADGMVSFVDRYTLAYTTMEDPTTVINQISNTFGPGVELFPIPDHYENEIFDIFDSACGLHINLLATDNYLYVPTFGLDPANQARGQSVALDKVILELIQLKSNKTVVGVEVPHNVCRMGGSVRCLGWQITGAIADHLVLRAAYVGYC